MSDEIQDIQRIAAHHEAGHAAAAVLLGCGIRSLQIFSEQDNVAGMVETLEFKKGPITSYRAMRIHVAGPVAEEVYRRGGPMIKNLPWFNKDLVPERWPASGASDIENAYRRAREITQDENEVSHLVVKAVIETMHAIQSRKIWRAVTELADMLHKFKKLSGDSAFAIVRASCS